jgi:hypothetical protein
MPHRKLRWLVRQGPESLRSIRVILGTLEGFTGQPPKQKAQFLQSLQKTLKIYSVTNPRGVYTPFLPHCEGLNLFLSHISPAP